MIIQRDETSSNELGTNYIYWYEKVHQIGSRMNNRASQTKEHLKQKSISNGLCRPQRLFFCDGKFCVFTASLSTAFGVYFGKTGWESMSSSLPDCFHQSKLASRFKMVWFIKHPPEVNKTRFNTRLYIRNSQELKESRWKFEIDHPTPSFPVFINKSNGKQRNTNSISCMQMAKMYHTNSLGFTI